MFEKVVVCLDGSELAEQILPYVTEEAMHFGSKVVLLQVISLPIIPMPIAGELVTAELQDQIRDEENKAKAYLERVAQPLRGKGLDVECVTLQGTHGEEIVNYAERNEVGLVAIATHGYCGLKHLVFGSTAEFVLRHLSRPVLVIKPQAGDK